MNVTATWIPSGKLASLRQAIRAEISDQEMREQFLSDLRGRRTGEYLCNLLKGAEARGYRFPLDAETLSLYL